MRAVRRDLSSRLGLCSAMGPTGYLLYLGLLVLTIYVYGLRLIQRYQYRRYPGPRPSWLIGGVTLARKIGQHKAYQQWAAEYGPGFHAVHLAGQPMLSVTEPEAARKILYGGVRPNFSKNSVQPAPVRERIKHSILVAKGKKWRDLRAAWQPMFFTGSLEGYMGIMDRSARLLVDELSWAAGKESIDIQQPIQDMTLNVVGQSAFGVELHSQKADQTEIPEIERMRSDSLREALRKFFLSPANSTWVLAARLFPFLVPVIRVFAKYFPDKLLVRMIDARDEIEGVVQNLVDEHIDKSKSAEASAKPSEKPGIHLSASAAANGKHPQPTSLRKGVAPGSFVDLLVTKGNRETGEIFSSDCITQQALTMLLAGYETTAGALTFAIYLLSRSCNADKQAKLVKEVDQLGTSWVPTYEDLEERLPYMDAVITESLRLFPPAWLTMREAETDLELQGSRVGKGMWVAVSPYAIHNDPRVWGPDVDQFLPERWLTQDPAALKQAKKGFFAFGHGPRVCPGSRFALLEMKLTLIRILQNFTLELGPDQEPLAVRDSITVSAKNGLFVQPIPRKSIS